MCNTVQFTGDHMLVLLPDICTHLLDIGAMHDPSCHIITKPLMSEFESYKLSLTALVSLGKDYVTNLQTLDLIEMSVSTPLLVQTFKSDTILENKLSIIHYLILHRGDLETVSEVRMILY